MGVHDEYGKRLLCEVAEVDYEAYGPALSVDYGAGLGAQIDGVVGGSIAVEIEARVSKQIRGAVLDLVCHPYEKKLLVILPAHAQNPKLTAIQCRNILARFVRPENFRVVVTRGHGHDTHVEADTSAINSALRELGYTSSRKTGKPDIRSELVATRAMPLILGLAIAFIIIWLIEDWSEWSTLKPCNSACQAAQERCGEALGRLHDANDFDRDNGLVTEQQHQDRRRSILLWGSHCLDDAREKG